MSQIKQYIEDEDALLLPKEAKDLEHDIIDMIYPLLQKLKEKGYIESLKDESGAFYEHIILLGHSLLSIEERVKVHKQLNKDFDPFHDDRILKYLKGYDKCTSDTEKKDFQEKLLQELKE